MKKIVCMLLFLMMGVVSQVQAGQFTDALAAFVNANTQEENLAYFQACYPLNATMPGAYGGSVNVSGSLCNLTGDFVFLYQDYQSYPGLVANGGMNADVQFDSMISPTYVQVTMDGGPVNYTYGGQLFEVYFDQCVAKLSVASVTFVAISGAVVINGQSYPLDNYLADLLML